MPGILDKLQDRALRGLQQSQQHFKAGNITEQQLRQDRRRILMIFQKQRREVERNLRFLGVQTQQTQQAAAATRQVAGNARTAARRGKGLFAGMFGGAGRAVGGSASPTPRQFIAAAHGNVSNTGRLMGLGAVAAGVGLSAAASPTGADFIMKPLQLMAAVIGSQLIPYMITFGSHIAAAAEFLRKWFSGDQDKESIAKDRVELGKKLAWQSFKDTINPLGPWTPQGMKESQDRVRAAHFAGRNPQLNAKEEALKKEHAAAALEMRGLTVRGMRAAMSPGAGTTSSLEQAHKKVQEAAMKDPWEMKLLQIQDKMLRIEEQTLAELQRRNAGGG